MPNWKAPFFFFERRCCSAPRVVSFGVREVVLYRQFLGKILSPLDWPGVLYFKRV